MSRETSLLVLESQAMFDAFGVDRTQPTQKWTGEEALDEATASGTVDIDGGKLAKDDDNAGADETATGDSSTRSADKKPEAAATPAPRPTAHAAPAKFARADMPAPSMAGGGGRGYATEGWGGGHAGMVAMRRVWTRVAAIGTYDGVSSSLTREIANATDALAQNPDSREKHRALVQELSYAGELDRARDIAAKWLARDAMDPQALGYIADLLGRDGQRELALRTLDGLIDLHADDVALHTRMVAAYERTGRLAQACSHRIAIASINTKDAKAAGEAARCLRNLGRGHDADIVMQALADDPLRAAAEKAAMIPTATPRVAGDLVIDGAWMNPADLDISLITPDGTRVSWMGGRKDVVVNDSTSSTREEMAIKKLRRGAYLIELSRADGATGPVRGTLDVTVLGQRRSLPFELTGTHVTVGRINVTLTSHLAPIGWGG
jgi:tetratricopeptide (TPR) repeat protein